MDFSNLRIFGLTVGILGMLSTILYFRGSRWNRINFYLSILVSSTIASISLWPTLVNTLPAILSLGDFEWGRVLALLIVSSALLWPLAVYTKAKTDRIKELYDRELRAIRVEQLLQTSNLAERLKPVTIVIPAFNEAANLSDLLPRIPKSILGMDVATVVIDDASQDRTSEIASSLGATAIRNHINRGQGAASKLGYDILLAFGVEYGVTMDGDNQHRPEDLKSLLAPVIIDEKDLVIGSRVLGRAKKATAVRTMGIYTLSKIISIFSGYTITDCSSGYKAFNRRWMSSVRLVEDQFQAAEVIIDTAKKGLRVGEVPIRVEPRVHGRSKKGSDFMYGLSFVKVTVKTWLRK